MIDLSLALLDLSPAPGSSVAPGEAVAQEGGGFADLVGLAIGDLDAGGLAVESTDTKDEGDETGGNQGVALPALPGVLTPWLAARHFAPAAGPNAAVDDATVDTDTTKTSDDEPVATDAVLAVVAVPNLPNPELAAIPLSVANSGGMTDLRLVAEQPSHVEQALEPAALAAVGRPAGSKEPVAVRPEGEDGHTAAAHAGPAEPSAADARTSRAGQGTGSAEPVVLDPSTGSEEPAYERPGREAAHTTTAYVGRDFSPAKPPAADTSTSRTGQDEVAAQESAGVKAPASGRQESATQATAQIDALSSAASTGNGAETSDERPGSNRQSSPAPIVTAARAEVPTPAMPSTSAAVQGAAAATSVLSEDVGRGVLDQIVQQFRMQFRNGIGEAVVTLKPEHLGEVTISLRLDRGAVFANVQAENPAVRQWLESQETAVRQALSQHGLNLERFVVDRDGQSRQEKQDQPTPARRRQKPPKSFEDAPRFEITV